MTDGILNIIPGLQATALLGQSIRVAKPQKSSRKALKGLFGGFTGAMVGIPLIGATAGMIPK
jgi:hypothetical protein